MDSFDNKNSIEYLPTVVVDTLLSFLDFHDKLKLRLVCPTTKRWIETSSFLKLLEDFPDNPEFIKSNLQNPNYTWNPTRIQINFSDYFSSNPSSLQYLGPSLKYLKLKTFTGNSFELEFLNKCSNLESLTIETLDLTGNPQLPDKNSKNFSELFEILKNLHHFSVEKIAIFYPASTELEYYGKFLKLLVSLKTLNVPYYTVKNLVNDAEIVMEEKIKLSINYAFILGPIIKYIARRIHSQPELQNLQTLDLRNFELCFFIIFPELIRTCYKSCTNLLNVNYALIRKLIAMRYESKLLKVVKSVQNKLVGNANIFRELTNVQNMSLDCDQCEVYLPLEMQTQDIIFFPELKELEMCIWSNMEGAVVEMNENFRKVLVDKNRKKLKKLTLSCNQRNKILISVQSICEHFVNLTHLRFDTFLKFTDDDFKAITKNLKRLKILEIDDEWGGITDVGISACSHVESGKLDIFTLKDLSKLRIRSRCKYTGAFYPIGQVYMWPWSKLKNFTKSPNTHFISDYSFKEVFKHMPLKSFLVDSADIHVTKLGYQYLLEDDCVFAKTIEYFPLPEYLPTGFYTESEFYQFRSNFKNFKPPSNDRNSSFPSDISSIFGKSGQTQVNNNSCIVS